MKPKTEPKKDEIEREIQWIRSTFFKTSKHPCSDDELRKGVIELIERRKVKNKSPSSNAEIAEFFKSGRIYWQCNNCKTLWLGGHRPDICVCGKNMKVDSTKRMVIMSNPEGTEAVRNLIIITEQRTASAIEDAKIEGWNKAIDRVLSMIHPLMNAKREAITKLKKKHPEQPKVECKHEWVVIQKGDLIGLEYCKKCDAINLEQPSKETY